VAVSMHLTAPLGEVLIGRLRLLDGRLRLVDGRLGLFGLVALGDHFACLGKLVAQLLGAGIGPRLDRIGNPRTAAERTGQTRSESGPTGQKGEGFAHRGRCYTARSSCLARTADPSGGKPGEADSDRRKELLGT